MMLAFSSMFPALPKKWGWGVGVSGRRKRRGEGMSYL